MDEKIISTSIYEGTHAGHPMAKAIAARIVLPLPYPRALYISPANRGNAKPATDLRQVAAAMADQPHIKKLV